jgi:pteridine reductase
VSTTPSRPQGPDAAQVALVTGSGIRVGRAIAQELARCGLRVWIHAHRSRDAAQELAVELGPAALGPVFADLASETDRARLATTVRAADGPARGRLDVLVCSAAGFESGPFLERSDGDLRRVLELNLVAPLALARAFAPALARADPPGVAIFVTDLAALQAWPGYVDHSVAKAGLGAATRILARELAPVRVCAVAPGTVAWPDLPAYAPGSPTRERILAGIPLARAGEPADVARAVAFLARESYLTGITVPVDGGALAASGTGYPDGDA